MTRLGARLSFAEAASELHYLKGVSVSAATARRRTEADGAVLAMVEDARSARVLAAPPPPVPGPPVLQVSVDGAMVPLVGGEWREVRTLAIGAVVSGRNPGAARCTDVSYFSRMLDAAAFTARASGEVQRRGGETAGLVVGVADGAPWRQAFLDAHCPNAARVLDYPHAAQRLSVVAEAVWGPGPDASAWAARQRTVLRDGDPAAVLAAIRCLPTATGPDPAGAIRVHTEVLGYLEPRRAQLQYAAFRAAGLPIGSGIVESANKLVVKARLKGAGRRWAEPNINPLLALRGALCSERWPEAWRDISRARRRPRPHPPRVSPPMATASNVAAPARRPPRRPGLAIPRSGPKRIVDGRPTAAHPWKRVPVVAKPPPAKL